MRHRIRGRAFAYGICLILWAVIVFQPKPDGSGDPEPQSVFDEGWSITGEQGARDAQVKKIEGTQELIYITYSAEPYIDVYDLSGAFQYTIHLPDSPNGGVAIDCRDGILIAVAKGRNAQGHRVFLFRGEELVESMDYDQAMERGLVPIWNDQESDYRMTSTHVTRADGEVLFELPPELADQTPKLLLTEGQQRVGNILFLIGFAAVWLSVVGYCLHKIFAKPTNKDET